MIAGRYTLEREVGRGGMGAVWLARDEVLGRPVAIKRIGMAPGGGEADLERAAREARLAAALNHPHVVAVFDLVTEDEQQWLVMEYVESLTLAQLVRREGRLSPESAAPLLLQAADALAAAHAAGIVHRDVKPSNILVTEQGQVKLTDFGIARAEADATLTQTGLVTGSPAYLAPEVASGQVASDASDVWSLGATCFHALAGHPPYDVTGNLMGALYRIVNEDPPRLADAGPLAPLLEATMARDPAQRWSMAEVKEFLADVGSTRDAASTTMSLAPLVPAPSDPGTLVQPVAPEWEAPEWEAPPRPPVPLAPDPSQPASPPPSQPTFEPVSRPSRRPARSRRGSLAPVAALAALMVLGLVGWLALTGGDGDEDPRAGAGDGSPSAQTPAQTPTRSPGVDEPTPRSKPSTPSAAAPPRATEMEGFVEDYLATVTTDPQSTWQRLTSEFREASGGFGSYSGFWSTIESAQPSQVTADPEAMTVSYTVDYTTKTGGRDRDDVTLRLVERKGDYLIAEEVR